MTTPTLHREDFIVASDPGVRIAVRAVSDTSTAGDRVPILLLHGARVPGLASFDLDVPGGSLAADLARAGHPAYIMDARGYGGSTRPAALEGPPEENPPASRSVEVARDVAAVVAAIRARHGDRLPAALGWATGGQWLGLYAATHPGGLGHLILLNSLYGGSATHPSIGPGSDLEDPSLPGRFDRAGNGAYRLTAAASLTPAWRNTIPTADKDAWRDPAIEAAYVAAALASDPTSGEREPASFRVPLGALEDSFYLASGRQLYDASFIRARALFIRGERDFWSRPADAAAFVLHAAHAPEARAVTLPDATHFVHLDRAERGRDALLREVLGFLA